MHLLFTQILISGDYCQAGTLRQNKIPLLQFALEQLVISFVAVPWNP
jgi:hypothetical protein